MTFFLYKNNYSQVSEYVALYICIYDAKKIIFKMFYEMLLYIFKKKTKKHFTIFGKSFESLIEFVVFIEHWMVLVCHHIFLCCGVLVWKGMFCLGFSIH